MKLKKEIGTVAIWLVDWIDEENELLGAYDESKCENGFLRYLSSNSHGKTFGEAAKAQATEFGIETSSAFLLYDYSWETQPRALTEDECQLKGVTARPEKAFFLGNFKYK